MHTKVPFLAVLIISIVQITIYGLQHNNYSKKTFDEITPFPTEDIIEIQMIDRAGESHQTKEKDVIHQVINYLESLDYQRLRNDETSYMPMRTASITFKTKDESFYLIPYDKEILMNQKTYRLVGTDIDDQMILNFMTGG